jgi:predicted transcriptional regulator
MKLKDNEVGRYLFNLFRDKLKNYYKGRRRYIYRIDEAEKIKKIKRRN